MLTAFNITDPQDFKVMDIILPVAFDTAWSYVLAMSSKENFEKKRKSNFAVFSPYHKLLKLVPLRHKELFPLINRRFRNIGSFVLSQKVGS